MSPYLFLLVIDVMSTVINHEIESKSLEGIKLGPSCSVLSHLFFADNALFFMPDESANCLTMFSMLQEYYDGSGLSINLNK